MDGAYSATGDKQMMTITEVNTIANEHGRAFLSNMSEDYFRNTDRETVRTLAAAHAEENKHRVGKSVSEKADKLRAAYVYNFTVGALQYWYERRQQMPDVVAAERIEYFTHRIERTIEDLQTQMERWATRFANDPADAFNWADDTMKAAAQLKVVRIIKQVFEQAEDKNAAIDRIKKDALRHAFETARYPQHSTSQPSNIMHAYEGAAWCEWSQRVE